VKVNEGTELNGIITNYCEIESDTACTPATADTSVGSWQPDSEIIYVDRLSLRSPGTGMSWRFAYRDLQDALERARVGRGSEIWVAAGTYKPTAEPNYYATFHLVDGVPIYGGFSGNETGTSQRNFADANNETILDGQIVNNDRVIHVVTADGVEDAVVDGFTIRGSYDFCVYDYCYPGAGVFLNDANIAVVNCKFIDNYIRGIDCYHSGLVITNSTFDGNNKTQYAIYANWSDVELTDCTVKNHTSYDYSIGVDNTNISMNHSVIEHNYGTGLVCLSGSSLNLTNSVIRFNKNCGIYLQNMSSATIKNSLIHNNAGDYGYGIFLTGQSAQLLVRNNTIVHNPLYGIYSDSIVEPNIVNCILYYNGTQIGSNRGPLQNVRYSCVQGGYNGTGNISDDPNFMNPGDPNDLHIDVNSHCIGAGDPNSNYSGETDIDGEGRVKYGRVDMGADEYYWSPADFNDDSIVNFIDYAIFAKAWWNQPGDPNWNPKCDIGIPDNNYIDYADLAAFCEDWLWQAGWTKTLTCGASQSMIQAMTAALASQEAAAEAAYKSVLAEQQQLEKAEPLKTEQVMEWLEQIWLDPEVRKAIDEDAWLKFIESLKEEL
jgi:hypothetical protein